MAQEKITLSNALFRKLRHKDFAELCAKTTEISDTSQLIARS